MTFKVDLSNLFVFFFCRRSERKKSHFKIWNQFYVFFAHNGKAHFFHFKPWNIEWNRVNARQKVIFNHNKSTRIDSLSLSLSFGADSILCHFNQAYHIFFSEHGFFPFILFNSLNHKITEFYIFRWDFSHPFFFSFSIQFKSLILFLFSPFVNANLLFTL